MLYFFYAIYPACGIIWFTCTMLPSNSLEMLDRMFNLYTIAVYIYGGAQVIQSIFGIWLIIGLWPMKEGNAYLKRVVSSVQCTSSI